jgi:flagellar biosynthesis protein FlhG
MIMIAKLEGWFLFRNAFCDVIMGDGMSQVWPIGGGKGGSGKSFLTGSLGMLLAKEGHRTLLIDLDLGAANLHTITGVPHPTLSLSDFIKNNCESLSGAIIETPTPNLFLISGAMNTLDIANLAHEQKLKIIRHIVKLPFDFILLDLGAGTSFNTLDFFMTSSSGIFVTTPEPTAIENIYRLIRSVYFRKIRQLLNGHAFRNLAQEAEEQNRYATVTNPDLLLHVIKELDPEKGMILEKALRAFEFKLMVNQQRRQDNPNIGKMICRIIERHLNLNMHFLGNVSFDDRVHSAVCKTTPFIDLYPYTQTALDLRECCRQLLRIQDQPLGTERLVLNESS